MHLKLMNSRTLAVTRPSKVVSALHIQKTLCTAITLSILTMTKSLVFMKIYILAV